jgi:hypothetical protein
MHKQISIIIVALAQARNAMTSGAARLADGR